MPRRRVRVAESFFEQLDDQLAEERGDDGTPSRVDFVVYELPEVVERFATDWDALPALEPGLGGGRMVVQFGILVHAFVAYGLLMPDDSIELIALTIDVHR